MPSWIRALTKPSVTNEPPTHEEQRGNDLAIIAWFLFAMFLGIGIRNNALTASRAIPLGGDLPAIVYPAGWIIRQQDDASFAARNPSSPSTFNSQMEVSSRPLKAGEDLALARTSWSMQKSRHLDRYRELTAQTGQVVDGQPAVLVTYTYIDDPTRAMGATGAPVIVRGQDLLFVHGDKLVVVTLAADDRDWQTEQRYAGIVFDALEFEEGE